MIELYQPLVIEPRRFMEAYNLDIEAFVERNTFKESAQNKGKAGGKQVRYMSYSHAIRLMREYFPELTVDCTINPETGSYIFSEGIDKGFFLKPFVHDGERRSPAIYYGVLDAPNMNNFNKNYYRAITKAIAVVTGIGLKLWTGDDLGEDVSNPKAKRLEKIVELAQQYREATGKDYPVDHLTMATDSSTMLNIGKELTRAIRVANKANSEDFVIEDSKEEENN